MVGVVVGCGGASVVAAIVAADVVAAVAMIRCCSCHHECFMYILYAYAAYV